MSGRVRQQSDCPIGKQGPMRATLPVSSLMKQSGGLRKSCGNSPTLSPTNNWRRASPDHSLSGQRSPGAVNYKGNCLDSCLLNYNVLLLQTSIKNFLYVRYFQEINLERI